MGLHVFQCGRDNSTKQEQAKSSSDIRYDSSIDFRFELTGQAGSVSAFLAVPRQIVPRFSARMREPTENPDGTISDER